MYISSSEPPPPLRVTAVHCEWMFCSVGSQGLLHVLVSCLCRCIKYVPAFFFLRCQWMPVDEMLRVFRVFHGFVAFFFGLLFT